MVFLEDCPKLSSFLSITTMFLNLICTIMFDNCAQNSILLKYYISER